MVSTRPHRRCRISARVTHCMLEDVPASLVECAGHCVLWQVRSQSSERRNSYASRKLTREGLIQGRVNGPFSHPNCTCAPSSSGPISPHPSKISYHNTHMPTHFQQRPTRPLLLASSSLFILAWPRRRLESRVVSTKDCSSRSSLLLSSYNNTTELWWWWWWWW